VAKQSEDLALTPLVVPVEVPDDELAKIENPDNPLQPFLGHLKQLIAEGLATTDVELFTYGMFYEWTEDPAGWKTYKDLAEKLPRRWDLYQDYLGDDGHGRLSLKRPPTPDVSARLGVAGALSLSAKLLNVTNADFYQIPSGPMGKTLDYTLSATNAHDVFQVEAKGAHDGKAIGVHKGRIEAKKQQQRSRDPRTIVVGVIYDLQHDRRKPSRLIVVDPPGEPVGYDARYLRTLYRLRYYLAELSRITRGRITIGLANRLALLDARPEQWTTFEGVPLVDQFENPLIVPTTVADTVVLDWRDTVHGRLVDLRLTGEARSLAAVRASPTRLYFRGLRREVLELLAHQDLTGLREIRFPQVVRRIRERDREGHLVQFESGLVAGLIWDAHWDKKRLPRIWRQLTGRSFDTEQDEE
jgi:hypothetical protein